MSRLIDADELLNLIQYEYSDSLLGEIITDEMTTLINAQPTVSQWIPCSERLPVEEGRYLVCGQKGGIYHANYRGRWWTQVGCGGKLVPSVVAWMPLPEPYKEEINEHS